MPDKFLTSVWPIEILKDRRGKERLCPVIVRVCLRIMRQSNLAGKFKGIVKANDTIK